MVEVFAAPASFAVPDLGAALPCRCGTVYNPLARILQSTSAPILGGCQWTEPAPDSQHPASQSVHCRREKARGGCEAPRRATATVREPVAPERVPGGSCKSLRAMPAENRPRLAKALVRSRRLGQRIRAKLSLEAGAEADKCGEYTPALATGRRLREGLKQQSIHAHSVRQSAVATGRRFRAGLKCKHGDESVEHSG